MNHSHQDAINTLLFNQLNPETFILQISSNKIYVFIDSNKDEWCFMTRKNFGKLYLLAKNQFMKKYATEIKAFYKQK